MKLTEKCFSALLLLGLYLSSNCYAQANYPNRPIRLIIPFTPGGVTDTSGRFIAEQLSLKLGQQVIADNKPGASGNIGTQMAATAEPDGYTLLVSRGGSQAITPALDSSTPYKWNDFTFISLLDFNPVVCVVKPDAPYKTMKDLIDAIRANPGKLNYATAGPGTTQHLAVEVILSQLGLPSTAAMMIPYKGGGEASTALLGGQVQFICNNLTTMVGQIKGGAMRALVTSTPNRLKEFPDVPTAKEMGIGNLEQVMGWSGLYGPPGLPAEVVTKWQAVLKEVAKDPNWLRGNDTVGAIPAIRSPQDTEKFAKEQFDLYSRLGTQLNLKK